ncbi:MAG TPA: PxKF domain-containing protein [Candidatus Limnocylindria bacterium]|nr:PxKF domain-containing protein [Candidatus Limnocylindria bacterium]
MPTRQPSAPARGLVLVLSLLFAIGGLVTAPPTPARAAATEWLGQKGSIADGSGGATAGELHAAGGSASNDAQFTYIKTVDAADGETGTWSFSTVADANGTISLPWRWTGLHAWFNVTARLDAVVVRGGSVVSSTTLVNAGPASCCTAPSNGFDYSGTVNFPVQLGDRYGFVIGGSNGDLNDFLRGELTVGQVPESCADAQALYGSFGDTDGQYVIHPAGGNRFVVWCADMATPGEGADYLEVRSGPSQNYGQYAAGGAATGTTVTTHFTKIRLDPATLSVDVNDTTFASSAGSLTHPDLGLGNPTVIEMPYATAMGCDGTANGTANIDLQGTPFAVTDSFQQDDLGIGGATLSAFDQVVDLTGGGGCGWTQPTGGLFNPFNPDAQLPNFSLDLRYLVEPPAPSLDRPVLFASIARSATTADLYARIGGADAIAVTVDVHAAASCTNGTLDGGSLVTSAVATTDADGYVRFEAVPGISSGQFVTITVTDPVGSVASVPSACIRTTADNGAWPTALPLQFASPATVQDVIESDGRARWYRFPVLPDQRFTVALTGLSADYDLAVFRDIGAEFGSQLVPTTSDELRQLSAEFAPSVFSPSVFSPSVFSPSVFSPDAYAPSVFSPSVFSPSVFSPSVFSPSVFSPSVFSPSVFSPSVFSPSVFSPSVFSPSVFSPSVFSPSVFSPDEVARAFSSAQTRSIIGVSATPGTGSETVVVNSWNESGEFYVRVAGRGGAFDPSNLFTLTVTPSDSSCTGVTDTTLAPRPPAAQAGEVATVIVTDSSRLPLGDGSDGTLADRLADLAGRPEVDGVIVDLATDTRVQQLRGQADAAANRGCPYAQNLVAQEVTSIIDSYRTRAANPTAATEALRYVTIVGDDAVVPFYRYPDQSLLGQESGYEPPVRSDSISEASLRKDYVLGQDAYGAGIEVNIRTTAFPIPDLAVGRLVETPDEITGLIEAYIAADGVITPGSSLVTGYDFLTDAADAVGEQLELGGTDVDELISDADVSPDQVRQPGMTDPRRWSWTADDLRTALLESGRHDLVFLAGHFSAQSALAADYQTQLVTRELVASDVDLENAIVISAGCHAGYNLVDAEGVPEVTEPLDWAQAFAQKRALLVAGTGYQYGDTDFLEYSERLYRDLAEELRAGPAGSSVSIGEALAAAKRTYISTTPDLRGIHEKAVLEATLFGLPMFGVVMPDGRGAAPSAGGSVTPTPVGTGPAAQLGLATHDLSVATLATPQSSILDVVGPTGVTGTVTATWLEGPDGVVTNPAEPAIPKHVVDVTATSDELVLRGVGWRGGSFSDTADVLPLTGAPTTELRGVHAPFVSPVFYPMRMWTPNHFGQLGGDGGTSLIVTPVQHRSDPAHAQRSIRRAFDDLDLRLFYADAGILLHDPELAAASLADAPTIVDVRATPDGADLVFSARVIGDPSAAIHEVWIVWTGGSGAWAPLDLEQCVSPLPAACAGVEDSRLWTARMTGGPATVQYVVQAANGTGLVSFDDNRGEYYLASTTELPAAVATALTLVSPPTSGTYGQTVNVTAELTAGAAAAAGKSVVIQVGGAAAMGVTGSDGRVTLPIALNTTPGATTVTASFGGDATHLPSSASAAFSIAKAPTALGPIPSFVTVDGEQRGTLTTLTATLGTRVQPIQNRTVTVTVDGPVDRTLSLITDHLGRVRLPLDLPAGPYSVTASFAGDETYLPASRSGTSTIVHFSFRSPINPKPTVNVAKAGSTVPVKFSIDGSFGLGILDGSPRLVRYSCETGVPQDEVEQTTTANNGLTFNGGIYQYNWKSSKSTTGCFRFELKLTDGSLHVVLIRLR